MPDRKFYRVTRKNSIDMCYFIIDNIPGSYPILKEIWKTSDDPMNFEVGNLDTAPILSLTSRTNFSLAEVRDKTVLATLEEKAKQRGI